MQIGFNIKTPQWKSIGGGTAHDLLAPASGTSTHTPSTGNSNAPSKEPNTMFAMPPAIVQSVPAASSVSHTASTASKTAVLGVCNFVMDTSAKGGEFPGYPMGVSDYLIDAIPDKFMDAFRWSRWGQDWRYHTKIQILRKPQHGELETSAVHNPGDLVYYPTKGYIGKDRVVVLATNTLPDGSPVRAKLIFLLNVIPIKNIPLGGSGGYLRSNPKYCPTGKEEWQINTAPTKAGGSHSQPQGSVQYGSPGVGITYAALPGSAVGDEISRAEP